MIALINYEENNTVFFANALKELNYDFILTNNETDICKADKVIYPGFGEASYAVKQLHMHNLFNVLRIIKKPILGICLGMQLMCEFSKEGNIACLGIFPSECEKLDETNENDPHLGWKNVYIKNGSPLFNGIKNNEQFFFSNSFYVPVNEHTSSWAEHGIKFSSSIEKNNFYGVQFHLEKSGDAGLKVLKNFIELC